MGVIHKLRPEIKQSIIDEKKANPAISCRSLSYLILQRFNIEVSKSSINSVFKEAGLSMAAARVPKKEIIKPEPVKPEIPIPEAVKAPEPLPSEKAPEKPPVESPKLQPGPRTDELPLPPEMPCTGAIFLKAADFLLGGSRRVAELIKNSLNIDNEQIWSKTEALIYLPLFQAPQESRIGALQALVGRGIPSEDIISYHNELQSVTTLGNGISQIIGDVSKEARCIKVDFSTKDSLYIDGQMYSVWSTPHTPYDFSTTIYNANSYINRYFNNDSPLILFTAPGYNAPTKEFFGFISGLESQTKNITGLKIYGNKYEELDSITLEGVKKRFFVFAMWPWQFVNYRKVVKIGEFKPFYFEPLELNLYLADIEIELMQPDAKQRLTLKGCALKTLLSEKTRVVILSNLSLEAAQPENLANIYLNRWPNLGETFQDYSRKIELFTYMGSSQRFFSLENLKTDQAPLGTKTILTDYLRVLDLYVRWHFLPEGFKEKDFPTIKEQFYGLNAVVKRGNGRTMVKFSPPQGYLFQKELEYACRRINEQEIMFADNTRLWCLP
ncbi:MAG: hypothetical protein PHP10_00835 [Candidatus Omnitrophica bacterium]|nr:hypothetical protein [Candidatus Omnitrophota bacterium]